MEESLHAVLLPWSAFGHMIPFFQLGTALAEAGVHVTLVQTPRNIERLPEVPSNLKPLMTLVALPMPQLENGGLPNGAEATVDIPFEKMPLLKSAYDLLQHPFEELVADQSPNWIIIDFMSHWVIDIAYKHYVPVMYFSVFCAAAGAFYGPPQYLCGEGRVTVRPSMESLMSPPHWINFPSLIAYKKHEARDVFFGFFGPNGTENSDAERVAKILNNCQAISIRTCNEFEKPYLDLLRKISDNEKPVIPTGLLPPQKPQAKKFNDEPWNEIFKWLDKQTPKSVVFVGFGSECMLSKDQVHEIAYGLELSEVPFLWALRKPKWAQDEVDALPPGFGSRTRGKGVVGFGWAPQIEILAHPSIGGSLFHSGWGSVIETLQFGHSLVVLPFIVDQGLNARLLVEKGLAIEIERAEDGSFSRDDIAKALRVTMVLAEGHELRFRARKAAKEFGDRKLHQEHYIGQLVKFLKSWNEEQL